MPPRFRYNPLGALSRPVYSLFKLHIAGHSSELRWIGLDNKTSLNHFQVEIMVFGWKVFSEFISRCAPLVIDAVSASEQR